VNDGLDDGCDDGWENTMAVQLRLVLKSVWVGLSKSEWFIVVGTVSKVYKMGINRSIKFCTHTVWNIHAYITLPIVNRKRTNKVYQTSQQQMELNLYKLAYQYQWGDS
jgi:hypothetical protein